MLNSYKFGTWCELIFATLVEMKNYVLFL